ncbi:MAG: hypothetical protein ACC662_11910, partial [Planctomycetota bacterium]
REGPTESAPAAAPASGAAVACEKALDEALRDLEATRKTLAEATEARDRARAGAEGLQAKLDAADARLEAYDRAVTAAEKRARALEETTGGMTARVEELEARRRAAEDAAQGWLRDVASHEEDRLRRARERAAKAGAKDVRHLAELLAEDAARAKDAVALLASLKPSEAADAVVLAVLCAPGAAEHAAAWTAATGPAHLLRPTALAPLLSEADPPVRAAVLDWLAAHASAIEEGDVPRVGEAVLGVVDAVADAASLAPAARLLGILRVEGGALRCAALLASDDPSVRAGAAYALSRVPDRAQVADEARKALPALLADPALSVRLAGVLLAEAVLGRSIDFDPPADEAVRRKALQGLDLG